MKLGILTILNERVKEFVCMWMMKLIKKRLYSDAILVS